MDFSKKKLQHQSAHEFDEQSLLAQEHKAREFEQVEDLLRHDAAQTPLPGSIALRLRESLADAPPPARPRWWNRWLKR